MNALRIPGSLVLIGLALALCGLADASEPTMRHRRLVLRARAAAAAAIQDQREQMVEAVMSQVIERRGVAQNGKASASEAQRSGTPEVQVPTGTSGVAQVSKTPAAERGVAKSSKVPAGKKSVAKKIQVPAKVQTPTKVQVPTQVQTPTVVQEGEKASPNGGGVRESEIVVPEVGEAIIPKVDAVRVGAAQESEVSAVTEAEAPEKGVSGVSVVILPEIVVSDVGAVLESVIPGIEVTRVGVVEEGVAPRVGVTPEVEVFVVDVGVADGEKVEEASAEPDHAPDGTSTLPPRERKAGCKSFYWKSFTSC